MSSGARIALILGVLGGIILFSVLASGVVGAIAKARSKAAQIRKVAPALQPAGTFSKEQQLAAVGFVEELAAHLGDNDASWVSRHQDADAYLSRTLEGIPTTDRSRTRMYQDIRTTPGGFIAVLMGADIRVKGFRYREGHPAVTIRCLPENGGATFIDFLLRPHGDGFRVIDAFSYLNGRTMGAETRENMALVADPKAVGNALGMPRLSREHAGLLGEFMEQLGRQDWPSVIATYQSLPPELHHLRSVHLGHIVALQHRFDEDPQAEETYFKALELSPAILGTNSACGLLGLDLHTLRGNHAEALRCVDSAIAAVGPDAHLQLLRANSCIAMGNLAQAEADIRLGLELESDYTPLTGAKIELLIKQRRYADTVIELDAFNLRFKEAGVQFTAADFDEESHADFRRSQEFKAWALRNPAKP